jgi:hypothetical protein
MRGLLLPIVSVTILAGCYKYVPVEASGPPPGVRANVVLSDAGTVEMARWVGPSTRAIEGDVVTATPEGLTVAVRRLERRDGVEEFWKGEEVLIPRGAVATYTERRLSRSRTALLTAGALAIALGVGQAFGDIVGIFGRGGTGTGSEK